MKTTPAIDFRRVIALVPVVHAGNVQAGWWSNLITGESILHTRNRPEILMLVVSELVEASDGCTGNLMDDKLPQYRMWDVELADAAIRLMDVLGAEDAPLSVGTMERMMAHAKRDMPRGGNDSRLFSIVRYLGWAMEHHRKGRTKEYIKELTGALVQVIAVAENDGIDLIEIINAKRAYNAQRADHKIENRMKADGKKY